MTMVSTFYERIYTKIILPSKTLNLLAIYRSPNENDDMLLLMIHEFLDTRGRHVLVGDFNFPKIDWITNSFGGLPVKIQNRFLKVLNDRFLLQFITEATRTRGMQRPHILDLLITDYNFVKNIKYFAPLGKSDHSVIVAEFCDFGLRQTPVSMKHCFNAGRFSTFKMTPELRELIKLEHYYLRTYMFGKNELTNFRQSREEVRKLTRSLSREKQNEIAKNYKLNPKVFWKYVNNVTHSRDKRVGEIRIYENMVLKKLNGLNLNKSPGHDGIHPSVLWENSSDSAFLCLYKSLVRSQLEFSVQVWYPYRLGLAKKIEYRKDFIDLSLNFAMMILNYSRLRSF
ncbi:hypothetical protein HELRODRAFT_169153 [Helobdella robusta]|uniref:Endonuclease/exonuclease/phosphatase domain-containing protein n=1 Tax=Helobdella robusta TaxID=6412 RepID=T1F1H5_HELRO|nr:hypothetical protein HELRODRAFT_169153 [Helobdella robusta]ESO08342.1 hypothetical protein HELRODRAFT_169153 [Helobdella robusta]